METQTGRVLYFIILSLLNLWVIGLFLQPLVGIALPICLGLWLIVSVVDLLIFAWSMGKVPDRGLTSESSVTNIWGFAQVIELAVLSTWTIIQMIKLAVLPIGAVAGMLVFFGLIFWMIWRGKVLGKLMDLRVW